MANHLEVPSTLPEIQAYADAWIKRRGQYWSPLSQYARLAEEVAGNAPLAVGLAKRLVDLGSNVDKQTFLAMELLAQSILLGSEDAREGARALAERRPPRFTGR